MAAPKKRQPKLTEAEVARQAAPTMARILMKYGPAPKKAKAS
jgi:hypothetical protein